MSRLRQIAVVYGVPAGVGGLGVQVASAIHALAQLNVRVHAIGPGRAERWPLQEPLPSVEWHLTPSGFSRFRSRYTWLRWLTGRLQLGNDRAIARWASAAIKQIKPDLCYTFTQVGLETLKWAQGTGTPSVLENPNGHIANFRGVYELEAKRLCDSKYNGHPTPSMVRRVEEEYALANRIRVSSNWSKRTMQNLGASQEKIAVFTQPVNLSRFVPPKEPLKPCGPLRICFVGSLDLRKGFVYLLRAIQMVGPGRVRLEIVGATGDRCCRRLFERESKGVDLRFAPGDPIPAYQRAELLVLPTLEDGSPFAVAEAMASGLAVVVTDRCGAAEWVRPGQSGWVVPGANEAKIATAIEDALKRRSELRAMGMVARADTEARAGINCMVPLGRWLLDELV